MDDSLSYFGAYAYVSAISLSLLLWLLLGLKEC
jgi:hypothetical protein